MEYTFAELYDVDYLTPFTVDFMGEMAKDISGPRKEWICLANVELKIDYFDNGLRPTHN